MQPDATAEAARPVPLSRIPVADHSTIAKGTSAGLLTSWLARARSSSFVRAVAAIAGGTAVAQALTVLAAPILTRLYTPEDMGVYGLYLSFVGVASVAITLRYEVAIVAAHSEQHAIALTRACLVLSVLIGALAALTLELLRHLNLFEYGTLPTWSPWLAMIALVGVGWGTSLRYFAVRQGAFGLVGRFTITQAMARVAGQLLFSPIGSGGLITGEALGRIFGLRAFAGYLRSVRAPTPVCPVLSAYSSYPLVQLPSGILNALAGLALVPVFATLFGTAVAGQLALVQRIIGLPMALVGTAIADVFYGQAAQLARANPEALRPYLLRTMLRLALFSVPFALLLFLAGPGLCRLVFGQSWSPAGEMLAILAPWMAMRFPVSSVSRVIFLSRYQSLKLAFDLASLLLVFVLWRLALGEWKATLALYSMGSALLYVFYGWILALSASPRLLQRVCQSTSENSTPAIRDADVP